MRPDEKEERHSLDIHVDPDERLVAYRSSVEGNNINLDFAEKQMFCFTICAKSELFVSRFGLKSQPRFAIYP